MFKQIKRFTLLFTLATLLFTSLVLTEGMKSNTVHAATISCEGPSDDGPSDCPPDALQFTLLPQSHAALNDGDGRFACFAVKWQDGVIPPQDPTSYYYYFAVSLGMNTYAEMKFFTASPLDGSSTSLVDGQEFCNSLSTSQQDQQNHLQDQQNRFFWVEARSTIDGSVITNSPVIATFKSANGFLYEKGDLTA